MDGLCVFDATTGAKVSEWYVHYVVTNSYDNRPQNWTFQCLVNTLPSALAQDFGYIVKEWEDYVSKRLEECYAK